MNLIYTIVNKYISAAILFFAVFFPKIAVINTGYNSGVRMEDLLIVVFVFYQIASGEMMKIIKIDRLWAAAKPFSVHMACALIGIFLSFVYGYGVTVSTPLMFWARQFEYLFMIVVGYQFMKNWSFKAFANLVDFVYILMAGYAILQYFGLVSGYIKGQEVELYGDGSRVFSTTNGPYEYSGYLAIMIVYYFCRCLYFNRNKLMYVLAASSVVLMIMTESRMALVAAGVAVVLVIFKRSAIGGGIATMIGGVAYMISGFFSSKTDAAAAAADGRFSRFGSIKIFDMINAFIYDFQHGDFEYFLNGRMWRIYYLTSDPSYDIRISRWGTAFDGLCTSFFTFMFGCGMAIISTMDGNYMRFFFESGLLGLISWFVFIKKIYNGTRLEFNCSKNLYMFSVIMKYSIIVMLIQAIMIDAFEASKIVSQLWFMYGAFICMYKQEERNHRVSKA